MVGFPDECPLGAEADTRSPATGFTGQSCEQNVDDCPAHSCKNGGACVDGVNTYNCRCPPEWTGGPGHWPAWHGAGIGWFPGQSV